MTIMYCNINGNVKKCSQGAFSDLPRGEVLPGNIIWEDVQTNQLHVLYGTL